MRTVTRACVRFAVLTAVLELLTAENVAAADQPPANSASHRRAADMPSAQVECDMRAVRCLVRVSPLLLARADPLPRIFQLREMWRYAPDTNRWIDVTPRNTLPVHILPPDARRHDMPDASQVLFAVPQRIGLYLLRWTEDDRLHQGNAFVGRNLCNDVMIAAPQPPGSFAGCWPTARGAAAGYIPDLPPPRNPMANP